MQSERCMGEICGEDYEILGNFRAPFLEHPQTNLSDGGTPGSIQKPWQSCLKWKSFVQSIWIFLMVIVRELYGKTCIGCRSVYPHGCTCDCCCLTEWSIHLHTFKDNIQITSNNSVSKELKLNLVNMMMSCLSTVTLE